LPAVDPRDIPKFTSKLIPRLIVLFLSIGAIVYSILTGRTPAFAGLTGTLTLFVASFFVKDMRPDWRKVIRMVVEGGKDGLVITMSCAGIGLIIGGIAATGLGVKFSQAIIGIGQSNLTLALVMAAICCLIIGMGLPTAASYLMVVFIAAPAMTHLGFPLLTAHLFIFYYACMSAITPPVAVCAYAGAGIAGSDPLKTGLWAVRLGWLGFVLPFLWVYNPELLLSGAGFLKTLWVIVTCGLGIVGFAAMNIGFLKRPLVIWERVALLVLAVGLVTHIDWIRFAGLVGGICFFFFILNPKQSGSSHLPNGETEHGSPK